jgi:hypothetical protein
MVTLVSHISDYFEQFNSSLTNDSKSTVHDLPSDKNPLSYYVFDFERYSDKMGTLHDLRTFMIQRWHNSFFYATAYLLLIYGKLQKITFYLIKEICFFSSWSDVYEEQAAI